MNILCAVFPGNPLEEGKGWCRARECGSTSGVNECFTEQALGRKHYVEPNALNTYSTILGRNPPPKWQEGGAEMFEN